MACKTMHMYVSFKLGTLFNIEEHSLDYFYRQFHIIRQISFYISKQSENKNTIFYIVLSSIQWTGDEEFYIFEINIQCDAHWIIHNAAL